MFEPRVWRTPCSNPGFGNSSPLPQSSNRGFGNSMFEPGVEELYAGIRVLFSPLPRKFEPWVWELYVRTRGLESWKSPSRILKPRFSEKL